MIRGEKNRKSFNIMARGIFYFFWYGIKFPLRLLAGLFGRKWKKRSKLEQKKWVYVRNFSPGRLKNRSWGKGFGRKKKGKKRKIPIKKANNFRKG